MLTMQPLFLKAEGVDSEGFQQYRVGFSQSGTNFEYVFTVDDSDISIVKVCDEFTNATFQDPLVSSLYKSILGFHVSRRTT